MRLTKRLLASSATAAIVGAACLGAGANVATSRALATCTPFASTPAVPQHQSWGRGSTFCDNGASSYTYNVRLVNRAGNILTQSSGGPLLGSQGLTTGVVSCAGAYVHSFLYINVGGSGKSSTSTDAPLC
jgi:hypothetical protein